MAANNPSGALLLEQQEEFVLFLLLPSCFIYPFSQIEIEIIKKCLEVFFCQSKN